MKKKSKIKIADMFDGTFLTSRLFMKNLPLIMLFALFFIFYIAIRYKTESTIKEVSDTTEQIKKLQDKASEQRSIWQRTTLMIEVSKKLEAKGVEIATEPIKQRIQMKGENDGK
ncbi:MAG: hypothetical protein LBO06_00090 [Bacteroidales bacterium]|jgi:hypothetical protein|nr:hypothetical protein [Bacteroidales bacterium]